MDEGIFNHMTQDNIDPNSDVNADIANDGFNDYYINNTSNDYEYYSIFDDNNNNAQFPFLPSFQYAKTANSMISINITSSTNEESDPPMHPSTIIPIKTHNHSLPIAIIALMQVIKHPMTLEAIITGITHQWPNFRKSNGAKYSSDIEKVIKATLKTSGLFFKTKEKEFYFTERALNNYLTTASKRQQNRMNRLDYFNCKDYQQQHPKQISLKAEYQHSKKRPTTLTTQMKIKLNKVNSVLSRMKTKYLCDNKYKGVVDCIKMFTALIEKYLLMIKKEKLNAVYDLNCLNDKIIGICEKIDLMEKSGMFIQQLIKIMPELEHLCKMNDVDIMRYDGDNNLFSEPPNDDDKE